jgi:type I restriction enzyme S subunit
MHKNIEIPSGWEKQVLESLLEESPTYGANAASVEYNERLPRYIRITDIAEGGRLRSGDTRSIERSAARGKEVRPDDILLARSGATVGKSYLHRQVGNYAYAGYLIRIRPNPDLIEAEYLFQLTQSPLYERWLKVMLRAGAQPNINATEYASLVIAVPPMAEQRRIAKLLRTWDEAIEIVEQLIAAKVATRNFRFQELVFGPNWPKCTIGSVIKAVSRPIPTPTSSYTALGIRSHGKGTFHRTIDRPDEIDMDTVYRVGARDLIVNITFGWEGAIALAKPEDEGTYVSHRFPTFEINETKIKREFIGYAIKAPRFVHALGVASPGGAGRNRVLSKDEFLKIAIPLPPMPKQVKIADVLVLSEHEIDLLTQRRQALVTQKRGLMRKLLTGEWRVPMSDGIAAKALARAVAGATQ